MSLELYKKAYEGAVVATGYAQIRLDQAIAEYGADHPVEYPETAYYLPVILALDGIKVTKLGELPGILNRAKSEYIRPDFTHEGAKLNGKATLFAAEIIEACEYLDGDPYPAPWTGFLTDPILRRFGIQLVDFTIPGFAAVIGAAKDSETAVKIFRNLQSKGLMIFLTNDFIEQLLDAGQTIGVDYIAFPLGNFTQVIHVVNYALRAGLAFGGVPGGEVEKHLDYQQKRVRAFVLALGNQDDVRIAAEFGAMYLNHPTITDQPLSEEIPDWYVYEPDPDKMVAVGMELRGIKVTTLDVDVPILIGPAFEGESIRRNDMHVEFGGTRTMAFEWVDMVDADHIEDGKITLLGPDIDSVGEDARMPLAVCVKIYGRKMQKDFESVLERRLHDIVNFGEGLWHSAQRDLVWMRVSKAAYGQGFRLKHLGEIIIAKLKYDFPSIVDRVEITLMTDLAEVEKTIPFARATYEARDERMRGLTDEKCDTFYSCKLCQSFAPNHMCIITPERLGLCGAVNWLDARASFEIDPKGPNAAIERGEPDDAIRGIYQSVNEYVYQESNKQLEQVALYSFMELPMTSCGCFECIIALFPEANGVMITMREYGGLTPCGMSFSTLAGSVGGGAQTPGFMGVGRRYLVSRKFIAGDGGLARICWMPKELKEYLRDDLVARAVDAGLGEDFVDKIADEDVGHEPEAVLEFLEKVGHPALGMESII
ncbi:MAG: CO dehydrogenase/CO-methylating acetyl-CoA synthase complex subunit beta [Peptococcaceae bacterium]|jgi:acetyl-CoA synthase|nr:CO dehydrogenase/CO-methylating acetyl-CoA synthase complex subunit beta [Peptococcaceae bacterium]